MYYQRTLGQSIECAGIGLHSGRKVSMKLSPGACDTGIVFRRVDLGRLEIAARATNVERVDFATTLGTGEAQVKTVEHLLGALYGMGVDNAEIEVDSPEIPIMDGSAAPFVYLIKEAGIVNQKKARRYFRVTKPLEIREAGRWIKILPSDSLKVSYTISFAHPMIYTQTLTIPINTSTFIDQVAPARTFGFMKDVETLRVRGLALGGSVDNAVVLGESGTLTHDLRFMNEFVRHKILDLLGDISLAGYPLKAHVQVYKGGHKLHTQMANLLLDSPALHAIESSSEKIPSNLGLSVYPA